MYYRLLESAYEEQYESVDEQLKRLGVVGEVAKVSATGARMYRFQNSEVIRLPKIGSVPYMPVTQGGGGFELAEGELPDNPDLKSLECSSFPEG